MARMERYQDEDGSVDWDRLHAAENADGSRCYKCGDYLVIAVGHRRRCRDCENMATSKDAVGHDKNIRCPRCKVETDPYEFEMYELFQDGDHDVTCQECNYTFEISTIVRYSFTSPPTVPWNDAEEAEEEEAHEINIPDGDGMPA